MSEIALLRLLALFAAIAVGLAAATMMGKGKGKRRVAAVTVPLAGGIALLGQSLLRDHDEGIALRLFTLAALGLTLTRLVFSRWIRRQWERQRAGLPPQEPRFLHFAAFFPVFVGGIVLLAFALSGLEDLAT